MIQQGHNLLQVRSQPHYIQFYEVLSVNSNETEYKVGDIVIASFSSGIEFDLIKDSKMINKFDVLGKFNKDEYKG